MSMETEKHNGSDSSDHATEEEGAVDDVLEDSCQMVQTC